jgi:hypothetical protein
MTIPRDVLTCGHQPSKHSPCTTGTGTINGVEVCWRCSEKLEAFYMGQSDHYSGYLHPKSVITWTGGHLATITAQWKRRNTLSREPLTHVVCMDPAGNVWYGDGVGLGMLIHLHRSKKGANIGKRRLSVPAPIVS